MPRNRPSFVRILAPLLLCILSAHSEVRKLTILHTNDLHARVIPDGQGRGGFAEIAAVLRAEREGCGHCIHLNGGDLITGTPVSTLFQGLPIFEMANSLGIDAFTLGNHEFDHGWKRIATFRKKAKFPVLSANALGPNGRTIADAPYTILKVNGLRVGVIGLVMGNLPDLVTPTTMGPIRTKPVVDTVRAVARELEGQVDLIVALGHILQAEGSAILRDAPEVSVVVEGHNHRGREAMEQVEDRVSVGLRGFGYVVGRLDLEVDTETRRVLSATWKRIPVEGGPHAPDVDRLVQKWERRVSKSVDKPIGEALREIPVEELRTDVFIRGMREETGADFAYMNRGGVRDILPKGVIREREWYNIMPFDNAVVLARVQGKLLSEEVRAGRAVEPDREYVLAVSDYLVDNPRWRRELGLEGMQFRPTGRYLRQLMIDWTRKKRVVE